MKIAGPSKRQARIEIIPLIDVIFFLLATFVLVSLSMQKVPGVRVDLPPSATSLPHELAETVTITVMQNGLLHWEQDSVSFDTFLLRLMAYRDTSRAANLEPRILLNADRQAPYGQVVSVLNEIRKAQVEKVTIETVYKRI